MTEVSETGSTLTRQADGIARMLDEEAERNEAEGGRGAESSSEARRLAGLVREYYGSPT